jgi:hypothetical protein
MRITKMMAMTIPSIFNARFMTGSPSFSFLWVDDWVAEQSVGGASLSKTGLLRFLGKLGIRQRAAVEFFLPLASLLVHHAGGEFHLGLGFFRASEALQ